MMREKVLQALQESGDYLSGEALSALLGVSRTAVWKAVRALRAAGYEIESHPRVGYRLTGTPGAPTAEAVRRHLQTQQLGRSFIYRQEIDSTNREARRQAEAGAPHGLVVLAERQTAGRGRLTRHWESPAGTGIWMSLLLRPPFSPQRAPRLTLLAALAVCQALQESGVRDVGIKWPNDIMIRGKKVCGILTEMRADMDRMEWAVVGIGLNVGQRQFPAELAETASSLYLSCGRDFDRAALTAGILLAYERNYEILLAEGFAPIRAAWKENCVTLGRPVTARIFEQCWEGVAEDIDSEGSLLVRQADGELVTVLAGDVTLRIPDKEEEKP